MFRLSFYIATMLLAAVTTAQTAHFDPMTSPTQDQILIAGSSFDIKWQPGNITAPVTLKLIQGATFDTLEPGQVIAGRYSNVVTEQLLIMLQSWYQ